MRKEIKKFALKIILGEDVSKPSDLQFYLNNKEEIEKYLKYFKKVLKV
jgi:predicted transcriptional regulator